ncbi:hypothetical protein EDB19DRAFT_1833528 [Suillus lakei]|nr:hypothetical protein EDB19DRAFT_1833528 [Suillus lakei]
MEVPVTILSKATNNYPGTYALESCPSSTAPKRSRDLWELIAPSFTRQSSIYVLTGGFLLDGGVSVAALRVILPSTMTHLSGFASLNKECLAPHDTINTIIKNADGSHGIFELSFTAPSPSRSDADQGLVITGTDGWLQSVAATPASDLLIFAYWRVREWEALAMSLYRTHFIISIIQAVDAPRTGTIAGTDMYLLEATLQRKLQQLWFLTMVYMYLARLPQQVHTNDASSTACKLAGRCHTRDYVTDDDDENEGNENGWNR